MICRWTDQNHHLIDNDYSLAKLILFCYSYYICFRTEFKKIVSYVTVRELRISKLLPTLVTT